MNNTRYVNNKAILSKLSDLIDKYPDMACNNTFCFPPNDNS